VAFTRNGLEIFNSCHKLSDDSREVPKGNQVIGIAIVIAIQDSTSLRLLPVVVVGKFRDLHLTCAPQSCDFIPFKNLNEVES
jgi:hypothetical protein